MIRTGLDVGSTTLKCVALDESGSIIYSDYKRHYSKISDTASEMLRSLRSSFPDEQLSVSFSGSAGMGFADELGIPFVQEVYATRTAVKEYAPDTQVVIELGGEDAKILFLEGNMEVRMNGSCAGGTGAFIDQMATLLDLLPEEMNSLAHKHEKVYSIASRCGVFAKSDIQPLINQGASKKDICASIFQAVVNQTIAGLAQGREISGKVLYLGGPLTFLPELRRSFDATLGLTGTCPENSLYYVAIGSALSPHRKVFNRIDDLIETIDSFSGDRNYNSVRPLFVSKEEYDAFSERHSRAFIRTDADLGDTGTGEVWIGIDAGSTTVKAIAINSNDEIIFSKYMLNSGNPVETVKRMLDDFYSAYPGATVVSSCVTGYGEEIIKNAFGIDHGIVETVAHYTAAYKFDSEVDFIIDIGGQDIKCFKIRNGAIDNIFLNEACSSGCGSFLQTFAGALGYSIEEFAAKGIFADRPVDLGSRCTVFMNSSVKQAQKDGATIENISAGLSVSVVKNAIYKVIRATRADELGNHIIVQGGTFYNDAVLRAFELEIGHDVIRTNISGLMGAYGCALYSKKNRKGNSTIASAEDIRSFSHTVRFINCGGCENNCKLTVNTFSNGKRFISGNRCEKPLVGTDRKNRSQELRDYDMFLYKQDLIREYMVSSDNRNGTVGIPMGLNMYEMLPFWSAFFRHLGIGTVFSDDSSRSLYLSGMHTIPSDTVCYPAKLLHGHIDSLIRKGVDTIFYPCLSYNFDEHISDNHYNCPVVAYYPEVLSANVKELRKIRFIYDYINPSMVKEFKTKMSRIMLSYFSNLEAKDIYDACDAAYSEYAHYMDKIRKRGKEILEYAKNNNRRIIVLCGRPYHIDPEINHGINEMIRDMGAVIVTEDSVSNIIGRVPVRVLNQWTYHARLYSAAEFVAEYSDSYDINLVQLVSFGCGVDAITTDEVRRILESNDKIYTQIKIDEITNLGAVRIRLRSLFAALDQKDVRGHNNG